MKHYFITWEIDIAADSPEEAARMALEIQRDPESIALVFKVKEKIKERRFFPREEGEEVIIDLEEINNV